VQVQAQANMCRDLNVPVLGEFESQLNLERVARKPAHPNHLDVRPRFLTKNNIF